MNPKLFWLITAILFVFIQPVQAQQAKKVPRIGCLLGSSASFNAARIETFQQELRELGYVEGKNISVEYRYAEGQFDRLPDLAAELVQLKVDLIIAIGDPAILAAKQATKTTPIVFVAAADPVGDRF